MISLPTALAITFLVGAITAAVSSPLARLLAVKIGALAYPGDRHVHAEPTPTWGGLAILLGFLLVIGGILAKFSGINMMAPFINDISIFFIGANACFLAALIVDYFVTSDR